MARHTNAKPVDGRATAGVLFCHRWLSLNCLLTGECFLLGLPRERTHTQCLCYGYGLVVSCWRDRSLVDVWWFWRMVAVNSNGGNFIKQHDSCCLDGCWCSCWLRDGCSNIIVIGPHGFVDVKTPQGSMCYADEQHISLSTGSRDRFLAGYKTDFPPSYRAAILTITALGDRKAIYKNCLMRGV